VTMAAGAAAMLALTGAAAAGAAVAGMPAGAVAGCGVVAVLAAVAFAHALAALVDGSRPLPLERPYVAGGADTQLARAATLDAQLEFAPVALFRVEEADSEARVEPLNASARRLLAPGRAIDPAAFGAQAAALEAGARRVIELETERGNERALAGKAALTLAGKPCSLVALMPMETELQAEAMQAWETLVRVLSHEIMNSLTPVASLAQTSRALLADARHAGTMPADLDEDLDVALEAIGRRADSLASFVDGYRQLASVPDAVAGPVSVAAMLARLEALVGPAWRARGGAAVFVAEPSTLTLLADAGQVEQALVNLLQNAFEATAGVAAPRVTVNARLTRGGRLRIEVHDNGPGVPDDVAGDIFTPFFSTKGRGTGIGLAMVRQLVHRNGGAVRHAKSVGAGARFVITF